MVVMAATDTRSGLGGLFPRAPHPSRPCSGRRTAIGLAPLGVGLVAALTVSTWAHAQDTTEDVKVKNPVAVFAALDKVTARISRIEIKIDDTATFGALRITPRVCYSRPEYLRPKTTAFVQVDEIKLDESEEKLFAGWMLAESPGLHGVEHPVFDVWLTGCSDRMTQASARAPVKLEPIGGADIEDDGGEQGLPLPVRKSFGDVRRTRRRSLR